MPVKTLTVYWYAGKWYGQEINWKRSGSGFYREASGLEIPQDRAQIEEFAREYGFLIEWRGRFPEESAPTPAG